MVTQKQRSETTRAALLAAFRKSLLDQGLEATTTAKMLAETGLSKGALYHHFKSKTEIVEAIYEAESRGAIERASATVDPDTPPLVRLREACVAWLAEVQDPDVAQILFEIGPEALGPMRAKAIEDRFSLRVFESLLAEAHERGEIALANPTLTARFLNALMAEASFEQQRNPDAPNSQIGPVIDGLVASMAA
ncbi:MAG: TetR/AcrR family transcriptional regulator [Erythrobacter sp.]|nr:TetR/AcrR family transcriptional regulator [Erythrobacter sp.]